MGIDTLPDMWSDVYMTTTTATTKARQTGTLVTLDRGDDLPWMLVCEAHEYCCEFDTKREAVYFRSSPIDWCEDCADEWRASREVK